MRDKPQRRRWKQKVHLETLTRCEWNESKRRLDRHVIFAHTFLLICFVMHGVLFTCDMKCNLRKILFHFICSCWHFQFEWYMYVYMSVSNARRTLWKSIFIHCWCDAKIVMHIDRHMHIAHTRTHSQQPTDVPLYYICNFKSVHYAHYLFMVVITSQTLYMCLNQCGLGLGLLFLHIF